MRIPIPVIALLVAFVLVGCASRESAMQADYDELRTEIDALTEEMKALVNMQSAYEQWDQNENDVLWRAYLEKKAIYESVAADNDARGY